MEILILSLSKDGDFEPAALQGVRTGPTYWDGVDDINDRCEKARAFERFEGP